MKPLDLITVGEAERSHSASDEIASHPAVMSFDKHNGRLVPLSLTTNFLWAFIGNAIYAGSSGAMFIVLAKLGTTETVGQFALGLAVTAPIILFANLQLRAIQATDAQRLFLFRDYFGLRLTMMLLAILIIMGIVLFSSYQSVLAITIIVIGLGKAVDAISDVIYGQLQQQEQMDRISRSLILKGIVSLVMLTLGQYLTRSVLWAAVGWSLASAVVVVAYDLPNGAIILKNLSSVDDSLYPRFDLRVMARLAWLALPLGITTLLISLITNIPRYFIAQYSGERGLGIFAAIAFLATVGTTITAALGQSASPRLAKQYAAGENHQFLMLLLKLALIGVLLGCAGVIVAVVAGKPILTLLYQPEYAAHNDVLIWIMIAAGVSYVASFSGYGVTSARYFKVQPVIFAACAVLTVILCALLIPPYGLLGAAWAILIANIMQLLLTGIYMAFALINASRRASNI